MKDIKNSTYATEKKEPWWYKVETIYVLDQK